MKLVFGGAHQGKLDFALEHFHYTKEEAWDCSQGWDFSYPVLYGVENLLLTQVREGKTPSEEVRKHLPELEEKVLVITDISNGIVPIQEDLRLWREEVGRSMVLLSHQAEEIYRVFCGIGTQLK